MQEMTAAQKLNHWLEYTVQSMVDEPVHAEVTHEVDATGKIYLTVRTAPGDLGKVIGKNGRIARSFRILVAAMSMKQQVRAELEIAELIAEAVPCQAQQA